MMEKENVLEIEITKINDKWSAITVKEIKEEIKKDFRNNGLFEWISIGGNYLCDGKIFINRLYPNIPFITRNETAFLFKDIVDRINEKYGIPKRWRAEKDKTYFAIYDGEILSCYDYYDKKDNEIFELGNYFKTEEEAKKIINSKEWQDFWAKVRAGEIGE